MDEVPPGTGVAGTVKLSVENLILDYGGRSGAERALDGVSLSLDEGRSLAIVGPSGCGKTSLLFVLAGLLEPTSGEVILDGSALSGPRAGTSIVFQEYGLFPWKTGRDNVALAMLAAGTGRAAARARALDLLSELGIPEAAEKYPSELSGGQRQRLAIARALAVKPRLMLLDEPSSSLDAITKEAFQRLVLGIYKRAKPTMILVTHDIEEAVFLGERIAVMEKGKIAAVVENPLFGDEGLRDRIEYYGFCLGIRRLLGRAS